jgi:CBS domain-containing protein
MRRQNIGTIVVEKDGVPVGIVTDRDLAMRIVAEEVDPAGVTVGSIMSRFPVFLTADRELGDAIQVMQEMNVRRLPVVDTHGRLRGMLSLDDVLVALAGQMGHVRELLRGELVSAQIESDEPIAKSLDL